MDDGDQSDSDADHEPQQADAHDSDVLDDPPVVPSELAVWPDDDHLEDGRDYEGDGVAGQGTDQRDHQIQVRDHGRQDN